MDDEILGSSWSRRFEERSIYDRVKAVPDRREADRVGIVDFRLEHAYAFRQLNLDWINLYHKLGFKSVEGGASPYDRCNIQMEIWLAGTAGP